MALHAQPPTIDWARQQSGAGLEMANVLAFDSANVYCAGIFDGPVDFDPGPAVLSLTPNGMRDVFIARLDSAGNLVWVKTLGGPGQDSPGGIKTDAQGNVYVAGDFNGTVDFDPGPGVFTMTALGGADMFVLKLDANGNFSWAKQFSTGSGSAVYSLARDSADNLLVTGYFQSTADFDPGPGVFSLTAASSDGFVCKLDANGNFVWAIQLSGSVTCESIAADGLGNVLVSGSFGGTVDFDPGPGVYNIVCAGNVDIFLLKLDANGNFTWVNRFGSFSSEYASSVTTDSTKCCFITGKFSGTVDFDPGPGVLNKTAPGSSAHAFVGKYDAAGGLIWVKDLGGNTGGVEPSDICLDRYGCVYTAGHFSATADFDPGPGVYNMSGGISTGYISKLDGNGNFTWAIQLQNAPNCYYYEIGVDDALNVYADGYFGNTCDFDPGPGSWPMTGAGSADIFVQRLNQCVTPPAPFNVTPPANLAVCSGDTTQLIVNGLATISWYDAATGGNYLGSGTVFTTPPLNSTTTFYAQDSICQPGPRTAITVNVVLTPPLLISANDTTLCTGDSLHLSASGSGSYVWNPGNYTGSTLSLLPMTTTTYTLTGTAGPGCSSSGTVTLTVFVNALPVIGATATPGTTVCAGDAVLLHGSGGSSYGWSGGVTDSVPFVPVTSTTYTVTGIDANGCTGTAQVTILVNALPAVQAAATTTFVCVNGSPVTLSGTPAGGSWSGPGVTGSTFDPSAAGAGTWPLVYAYTDANGCTGTDTLPMTVDVCTGMPAVANRLFSIQPKEAHTVTISAALPGELRIVDALGREQGRLRFAANETRNVTMPRAGVYFFTFVTQEGACVHQRIVVQ